MKKIGLIIIGFLCLGLVVYGINTNFEILSYHIEIDVNDDNTYDIKETIEVQFNVDRHGIIRNIPLMASNGYNAKVSDIKVNQPYTESIEANQKLIKIGDADVYAPRHMVYEISYKYQKGEDFNEDMDELYYNLIGLDWDVYIHNISFEIKMPFDFDDEKLNFTHGLSGSKDNTGVVYDVNDKTISGYLKTGLGPSEALTIALPLEEGYFVNAKVITFGLGSYVTKYRFVLFPGFIVFSMLLYFLLGRNKQIYPTVEFYPPEGLTPADLGFIYDGAADPQDVTSLIIYWADKGYLEIIEQPHPKKKKKTELILNKLMELDNKSKPYEKEMFKDLFKSGNAVPLTSLKKTFYVSIISVQNKLKKIWHENKKTRIYSKKTSLVRVIILLVSYAAFIGMFLGLVESNGGFTPTEYIPLAVILSVFWHFPIINMTKLMTAWERTLPKLKLKKMLQAGFWLLISVGSALGYAYYVKDVLLGLLGVASCVIITSVSTRCLIRTTVGNGYLEKILGFKDFIKFAELDRIKMLVDQDPTYFFHVLPYAIVFSLTDKWAKKFEAITIEPPSWFKQTDPSLRYSSYMYGHLFENTSQEVASYVRFAPRPSNSGGGGGSMSGGSAGGGDGGGGGSDW